MNTTPAVATTATTTGAGPVTVIAPHGQSYRTGTAGIVLASRDSYSITTPAPRPRVATAKAPSTAPDGGTVVPSVGGPLTGAGAVRRPFPGLTTISSPFGYRSAPCAGCTAFHEGTDLTPGAGTPIGSVAAGTVAVSGWHPNYGQYVIIDHVIDGRKISSLYGHMQAGSSPLHTGDPVTAGTLVGLVGNTTGAHLHLEIRLDGTLPVDPMIWLTAHGA
ncbi:M23 family metallopeptidase [Frondihabitans sp. Leaf304]|uniref:M23 family metallopeptidase n=1 Tax=Frondihabitans sp. Leaf304 TaxID=1736329 RepID=UPI0012F9996E|nr:M23 family metallopeptidase [Frondihabitans sp. Leaf304]